MRIQSRSMGRWVLIGDVHGCGDELRDLLERVGPSDDDRILLLGDLVDRGPQPLAVMNWLRETRNACAVLGNHDRRHIRWMHEGIEPARAQRITRALLGSDYPACVEQLAKLPLWIELPEAYAVHGMLEPDVPLASQREDVLTGEEAGEDYLNAHYPWPWYEHYRRAKPIVCGHHDYLGNGQPLIREGRVYAVDTACVHGCRLTALVLPDFQIISVPARGDHWNRIRRSGLDG